MNISNSIQHHRIANNFKTDINDKFKNLLKYLYTTEESCDLAVYGVLKSIYTYASDFTKSKVWDWLKKINNNKNIKENIKEIKFDSFPLWFLIPGWGFIQYECFAEEKWDSLQNFYIPNKKFYL